MQFNIVTQIAIMPITASITADKARRSGKRTSVFISLHDVETVFEFLPKVDVHHRLLSTCVGSFGCPGIDNQVNKGVSSNIPSLYSQLFVCALAGIEPTH
jgi:hypothetical protein